MPSSPAPAPSVGDLVADCLRHLGVTKVYGSPLGDLECVDVDSADLALLLADAEGRLGDGWGAAMLDGQLLHLSCQPGGTARPRTVTSLEGLIGLLVELEVDTTPRTVAVHLDLDLGEPVDEEPDQPDGPDRGVLVTLSPSLADLSIVAIVGPGLSRGHHEALGEFAARGGIGVLNSWGAKGVLRWDSPFHFGTVGLQEHDLEAAGLGDVDLVITSGLDPDEVGVGSLGALLVQDVPPWQLAAALTDWPRAARTVDERPPLYARIAEIVTPMYEAATGPITPPRAALHLSGAAPADGVVVADAGVAGFWIARTFPTGLPGSVVVPALDQPGFAAAAALVAGLAGRPCVAVIDGPPDDSTLMVLEEAARRRVPVSIQSWVEGATSPDDHVEITRRGFAGGEGHLDVVGLDGGCLAPLVDALGPITAWADRSASES